MVPNPLRGSRKNEKSYFLPYGQIYLKQKVRGTKIPTICTYVIRTNVTYTIYYYTYYAKYVVKNVRSFVFLKYFLNRLSLYVTKSHPNSKSPIFLKLMSINPYME